MESSAQPVWRWWRWSSHCKPGCNGGTCVEVAEVPGYVLVRDGKDPNGPWLTLDPLTWKGFLKQVRSA